MKYFVASKLNSMNTHYLSGYMISALILFIALVSFTYWIVSLTKDPEQRESYYILPEGKMPIQKAFLVYTFGHAITVSLRKNLMLYVEIKPKLQTDLCGHFGYFSESNIIVFTSNHSNNLNDIQKFNRMIKGYYLPIHSITTKQEIDKRPHYFSPSSMYVQSSEYFWIIGN